MFFEKYSQKYFKDNATGVKKPSSLKAGGYTLIELLIVIVSISLLFSLGYSGYREFQRRQEVQAAARQIRADMRYAQELAFSGRKPSSGCSALDGYILDFEGIFLRTYDIAPVCDGGSTHPDEVKTGEVPSGIVIDTSGGVGSEVTFNVLGRGTDAPPGNPLVVEIGQNAQLSPICQIFPWLWFCSIPDSITVTVTSSGEIY